MPSAVALGFGGYVDLDVTFGEFFFQDHTLMLWFMPQYPYAYDGPMVAENGTGTFMVGQADYRMGSGDFDKLGPSVLFVQVGSAKVLYEVPGFVNKPGGPVGYRNVWHHLALVRANNTMQLYLNGSKLAGFGAQDMTVPSAGLPSSQSKLRLGRRSSGSGESNMLWQFYGLLDDVGIFSRALTTAEISQLAGTHNLTGKEAGLFAAWNFDNPALPGISRTATFPAAADVGDFFNPNAKEPIPAYKVAVSNNRNSSVDADMLDIRPSKMKTPNAPPGMRLPFARYDVWKVGQAWEHPSGSHNGYAAFGWDLYLASGSTTGQTVYAVAPARAINVANDDPSIGTATENKLNVEHAPGERASYIHLVKDSYFEFFPGASLPQNLPESAQPTIKTGDALVKVSDHLHFSTATAGANTSRGLPTAFSDYFASNDEGKTWQRVKLGIPTSGQQIRRVIAPTSKPALASRASGCLDLFVRVEGDHLFFKGWDGANWSAWKDLGGKLSSAPAAVSWGPDRIDCFVRGESNHLFHKRWNDQSGWSDWDDEGGELTSAPAVSSRGVNRLDVFVRGQNEHLWFKAWDGSQWSNWKDLGGELTSAPAAVSWGPDRIDCFVRGENNHLWQRHWDQGPGWSAWKDQGGSLTADPAVCSRGPGRLDVFARGDNSHLWFKGWDGLAWSGWKDLGGVLISAPAAASWSSNRIDCFVQGQNQSLWQKYWNGAWSGWDDEGD